MVDPAGPGAELVEILDESGRVERVVSRAEMRAGNLRHRASFVVVVSADATGVLGHRRADWKDVWPGFWDLAFGGVAGLAEAPAATASRELAEETGLVVAPSDLRLLGTGRYDGPEVRVLGHAWLAVSNGPFTFDDGDGGEVAETAWVGLDELDSWLQGRHVCFDTLAIVVPRLRNLGR